MRHLIFLLFVASLVACSGSRTSEEEIPVLNSYETTLTNVDTIHSVKRDVKLSQLKTYPQKVILNGMPQHRLVSIYKRMPPNASDRNSYSSYDYDASYEVDPHFMPGLDLLYGYNLLNLSYYNMNSGKSDYLFDHPVLIKSVYYPSYDPDSIGEKPNRQPISRDYFLVSVYDEDTNADTLINRYDLRRMYHFNDACDRKTQLIPPDYSVVKSQYDYDNDVMYIFARHDDNKDGRSEESEATHIFWIDLKAPEKANRMY